MLNSKSFLQWGGGVLVLVGLLGFFGVIGPDAESSIFGETWWFDSGENWAHLVLGVVGIIASFVLSADMRRNLVLLLAILAAFFTVYNFFSLEFYGSNLESPMDLILHLVVAVWAFMSWRGKEA